MHMLRPSLAAASAALSLLASGLDAQETSSGYRVTQFVPQEYRGEGMVDRLRLEELEIWDGLARSPVFGMMNGRLESTMGFALEDVDSLRMYPGPQVEGRRGYRGTLMVLRGERLSLEGFVDSDQQKVVQEERGGLETLRVGSPWDDDPMYWLQPEPGVLVMGDAYIVEPVLDGERKGVGVPHAGLMPLQAGRGILAQFAFHMPEGSADEEVRVPIPDLDPEDPMHGMLIRLSETGDGEAVTLDVVLEFAQADGNAPKVIEMAKAGLEQLEQHPQFAAMKSLWQGIEFEHDGKQARAKLLMGDARATTAKLSQIAALIPMLFMAGDSAAPVAAPAQPGVVAPGKGGGR